jgi:hypothetical protein
METTPRNCLRCEAVMEAGFIPDHGLGGDGVGILASGACQNETGRIRRGGSSPGPDQEETNHRIPLPEMRHAGAGRPVNWRREAACLFDIDDALRLGDFA